MTEQVCYETMADALADGWRLPHHRYGDVSTDRVQEGMAHSQYRTRDGRETVEVKLLRGKRWNGEVGECYADLIRCDPLDDEHMRAVGEEEVDWVPGQGWVRCNP